MHDINENKKVAAIESIKLNMKLANLAILLIVFVLFFSVIRFTQQILGYIPVYSVAVMLSIVSVLVALCFYLANRISRNAISRLNEYSDKIDNMMKSMEQEITQRKNMEENLRAMSLTDELTGLNNRRGFMTLAVQYMKMVNRHQGKTFLFYADVDNFKKINDTYGHSEGDRVLTDIAEMLKKSFRDSDIIARLGGDEFVVLPVGFHEFEPGVINRRLTDNINELNSNSRDYTVSISVGVAAYDAETPCSLEDLLDRADKLMYQDKKTKS